MDVVKEILDWFSENSQVLSEAQKKEIHNLLNSLRGHLGTQKGSTSQDHKPPNFSSGGHGENKHHERTRKFDNKNASFQSKIDRVTNTVNKETGYIHGKMDKMAEGYENQIEKLEKKIRELEENQTNRKEREEKKESVRDIDEITASLKGLMNRIKEPHSFPSNSNPRHPQGPPPPYEMCPPMVPNPNIPYFPPNYPSQFHMASGPAPPPMAPPFPHSNVGPSSFYPGPSPMNQNVYRFSANLSSAPINSHTNFGAGHSKPRFDKPFPGRNDEKFHSNLKKKYCDPHWKKFDLKNKDQRSINEHPNTTNEKSQYKKASENKQSNDDSNKGKSYNASHFKNHADRDKIKRSQQFGKNRPQNLDSRVDSDTSVSFHISFKNTRKESAHKNEPTNDCKATSSETAQASTGKSDYSKFKNHENKKGNDTHTTSNPSKNVHKGSTFKTPHPCNSAASPNRSCKASTSKTDLSGLQKLKYPSKAEAVKMGIDVRKTLDSPGMCLGKKDGVPVSRPARCLNDIYNFEKEFGSCQVVRF